MEISCSTGLAAFQANRMSFIDRAVNGGGVIGSNLHREYVEKGDKIEI